MVDRALLPGYYSRCQQTTGNGFSSPDTEGAQRRNSIRKAAFLCAARARSFMGGPCGEPQGSPVPSVRSANPHGTAHPFSSGMAVLQSLLKEPIMANIAQLATVEFHGHALITLSHNHEAYFAPRPICEAIGLDWAAQFSRIKRNPVLGPTVVMSTTVAQDGKQREIVTLPLKLLNGWLFGIEAGRVKPELRETILTYQRECYDALAAYWQQGRAINPRSEPKVDVRHALLAGFAAPECELPSELQRAVDQRAFALAHEAYELIREHLRHRVAYHSECGYPQRRIHMANARKAIQQTTLGNALAQEHWRGVNQTHRALELMETMLQETREKLEIALGEEHV